MHLPDDGSIDDGRARMMQLTKEPIDRAKQHGTLRPDVTTEDVMLAAWGKAGIIANATQANPDAFRQLPRLHSRRLPRLIARS